MLAELASAVRERRVSATELVQLALARIQRDNPRLNAVVALRAERALEEARALDRRVARGEDPGPLAGLPFLVKDMEDVAGMRTTYGSLLFAEAPAAVADGLVPRRLRAAGAIPIGKTNLPEFAFAGFTDNRLFGATRNPWNVEWSAGGSSGGSAAALAAGMVPIATATDGGGSIRIPSALCGLAGLKPTNGVIGREPIPDWIDLSTFGPIASTVADARLLLHIEAGPVTGDPTALPRPLEMRAELPSRAFAAHRFVDYGPVPEGVRSSFESALARVERDLGLPLEPIEGGVIRSGDSGADWLTMCAAEHVHHLGAELVRANLDRFSEPFRARMERGLSVGIDEYLAVRRRRFEYVRELDLLLGDDAVLLLPTLGYEGWRPDGVIPETGQEARREGYSNTRETNLTGHPSLSVPAGVSSNGLPFGLQIVGPRFRDDLVLNLGAAWEAANPWPAAAPGFEPFGV